MAVPLSREPRVHPILSALLLLAPASGAPQGSLPPRLERPRVASPVSAVQEGALSEEAHAEAPDSDVAFRLDGEDIAVGAYADWLLRAAGSKRVQDFTAAWVVEREGRRLGIVVGDDEVQERIDADVAIRVEHAFLGQREEWLAELERTGRDERDYRLARATELHPFLVARAIAAIDRVVPEHHLRREWELRYGRNGYRYDVRMLFLRVVQDMEGQTPGREEFGAERERVRAERQARALEIRREWEEGADFGALAARYSEDEATRAGAGVPAEPLRHFGWPHAFNDALERLEPGSVSQPLWGRGGWWLVEVRALERTPFESVRPALEAELLARGPETDEVAAVEQRLLEGVRIQVLPAMFERPTGTEWPQGREPVMTIDGEPVTREEYALWLLRSDGSTWQNRFLEDVLLEREAAERGIVVGEEEVLERAREWVEFRMQEVYKGRREAFDSYLQATGLGPELYLLTLAWRSRSDLLAEHLILAQRTVDEDSLRLRWKDLYGEDGKGLDVRSLAVLIEVPELPPGLDPDELQARMEQASQVARERAAKLVRRARAGEDFGALAAREGASVRPKRVHDEIERFRVDQWPEEIAAVVEQLEPGAVSEPLRYGLYWVVFEAVRRTDVPFESVRDELRRAALERKPYGVEVAAFRNQLLKDARVEVLPGARR